MWMNSFDQAELVSGTDITTPFYFKRKSSFILATIHEADDGPSIARAIASLICKYDDEKSEMIAHRLPADPSELTTMVLDEARKQGITVSDRTRVLVRVFSETPTGLKQLLFQGDETLEHIRVMLQAANTMAQA